MSSVQTLFFSLFEFGIFLIILSLVIVSIFKFDHDSTKTRSLIVLFFIMNCISVLFSALTKYIKYEFDILSVESSIFAENYWMSLILYARLKYLFTILANMAFFLAFYEIFSKPKMSYASFIGNLTSIFVTLHFVPVFSFGYNFSLSICLFLQSLLIYTPILTKSYRLMAHSTSTTNKIIRNAFLMSFLMISLLLIALLDRLITGVFQVDYSLFYYLGWLIVLLVVILAFRIFVFSDWQLFAFPSSDSPSSDTPSSDTYSADIPNSEQLFVDKGAKKDVINSPLILVECPICHTTKYRVIPETTQHQVSESMAGISSMLIKQKDICEHTFLVYFDRQYKVRNVQKVDIVQ
ncbi:MAG: hypothetical protein ACTSYI_14685 [Promethearchaeota archaeon]